MSKERKESFVLHLDMLEDIKDMTEAEKAGFLDFVINYNLGLIDFEDIENGATKRYYRLFANQFDRDHNKWLSIKEKRSQAGKLSHSTRPKKKKAAAAPKKEECPLFEEAWKLYGCNGSKPQAKKYWAKLSEIDKEAIIQKIPLYLADRPEVKYRKKFEGWINPDNRIWEVKTISELEQEAHKPAKIGEITKW